MTSVPITPQQCIYVIVTMWPDVIVAQQCPNNGAMVPIVAQQ
jgi:hypothetical protein